MMTWLLGGDPAPGGELVWTAPSWVIVVSIVGAVVAWSASLAGRRSALRRLLEAVAWGLALAGAAVAMSRPIWLEEAGRIEAGRVAVLVDASASMGVLEGDVARSVAAIEILEGLRGNDVDIYHFGGNLELGMPLSFDAPVTDIEAALEGLSDRVAGERLAGVVLITDGLDRGLLRRRFRDEDDPIPPRLPGPLTVYEVGGRSDLMDLSVRSVDNGGYAYVHAAFTIRAGLLGVGFEGREVQVDLLKDGATVSSRGVQLDEAGEGEVEFQVQPDRAGRFTYMVQVPTYDGDAVPANNAMPVVVRVVRDKLRVLQVAGAPSWDVKFLRRFLKGDPSVDLVSFFILRTRSDMKRRYNNDELSLIEFPYRQLFTDDLRTFDLVVFQNFDHRPYFLNDSRELLRNLASFVTEDGHALVMSGGDRSFSLGAYGGTPLGDILPVEIARDPIAPDLVPFRAVLTEAGARHPVTRLVGDGVENELWWQRLHTLDGTNMVLGARSDATVLLTHPTLKGSSGKGLPVLAVREAGKGRTMSLTVDTSWRWSLSEAAEGRGNQAYLRFWKGAMRWLIRDPTTRRVRVDTSRENYSVDDEVRVVVQALDPDFAPHKSAPVRVAVAFSDGELERFEGVTGEEGEAIFTFPARRRGAVKVEAEVMSGDTVIGRDSTVYAVTNRDPELDEVVPDRAFLSWLAGRTGGTFYPSGEAGELTRDLEAGRTVLERRELALWRAPGLALWIALFAGLAWIVRRWSGLR